MPRFLRLLPPPNSSRSKALEPGTGDRRPGTATRAFSEPRTPDPRFRAGRRAAGFTLIELIIVVAIIGILATIAVPAMRTAPQRAREAALKEDLFTLRSCIDQFHGDRGRYPTALDELVSLGYLRVIPIDPVTGSRESWVVSYEEASEEQDERAQETGPGIIDVHSGSPVTALDGSPYAEW
jgi:general secretion pathway protein G